MKVQYTYKREADRTVLLIENAEGPDPGSFPVRMLCGGIIPGMLKCHLRNMDGDHILCYDATSLQTLRITCEEKKLKYPVLRLILENCIGMAERMEEYLLDPDQLLLDPDLIFVSPEKDRLFFAALPGRKKDIRQQLTGIAEYLLPFIDHGDREAMTAGYGFYKAVLSDMVPLSGLRKAVYKEQWSMEDEISASFREEPHPERTEPAKDRGQVLWEEEFVREGYRKSKGEQEDGDSRKRTAGFLILPAAAVLLFALMAFILLTGRTGLISMEQLILGLAVLTALGAVLIKTVHPLIKRRRDRTDLPLPPEESSPDPAFAGSAGEMFPSEGSFTEVSMFQGYSGFRAGLTEAVYAAPAGKEKSPALIPEESRFPVIVMNEGSTMIGSLPGAADAVIRAPEISRIHARIRRKQEKICLIDLHSKNGTYVNDLPLSGEERTLMEGDTVRFADINYTVGTL